MNRNRFIIFFFCICISNIVNSISPYEVHNARTKIRAIIQQLNSNQLNINQKTQLYDKAAAKAKLLETNGIPAKKIKTEIHDAYQRSIQNVPIVKQRVLSTEGYYVPMSQDAIEDQRLTPTNVQPQRATRIELQSTKPSGPLLEQIRQGSALKKAQERQLAPKPATEPDQAEQLKRAIEAKESLVRPAPQREDIRPMEEWE